MNIPTRDYARQRARRPGPRRSRMPDRRRESLVSRRSKNETPGRTGFAHLFEHLMFEGSQHYDKGYFHPFQEAGAC